MPSKSIFRQPGAKHFQLVHRSQRDPLIHDPDASKHVLRPIVRESSKKGKSRADLEALLSPTKLEQAASDNIGEAALYGIYYDDSEYDYMQHLRTVGVQEEGVESILIDATSSKKNQTKSSRGLDLPQEVLPPPSELPRTYESQQTIPESILGFQPDMDPHLRQTLEALEDDAFVDDTLQDNFFSELLGSGERGNDEDIQYEFDEDGIEGSEQDGKQDDEVGWEERFHQFKKAQATTGWRSDDGSEAADTVDTLPSICVMGGKKRRKGTSDVSGYSMSSSSMYRNEALRTLDERFDQMILTQYDEDNEQTSPPDDEDSDEVPELISSREDFESMIDEFLNNYDILGRKMKPKLEGDTGTDKLDTIRRALGQDERVRLYHGGGGGDILMPVERDDEENKWDCETILSTYSNLKFYPRLIRVDDRKMVPKIPLNPKTGFPIVEKLVQKPRTQGGHIDSGDSSSDTDTPQRQTITRPKDESKEQKRARKSAVKAERQARRIEKKMTKEQFNSERKVQVRTMWNKEKSPMKL